MPINKFIQRYYPFIVGLLLISMLILEISSSLKESQTIDEGVHLAAGYSYLMKNDFRMNTEHPPLIKEIAALPLVIINNRLEQPFNQPSWTEYNQWQFAKDLIYYNNLSADTILFLGRLPIMLLSLLLGFFIFRWSRELFGTTAGIFSLILYCFSPNILAHSKYVTTDLGLALFFFLTIYYFYKYLKSPSWKRFIVFCLCFSLTQAVKFSALLLLPTLLILILAIYLCKKNNQSLMLAAKNFFRKFVILFGITAMIIFSVYGFNFQKPIDDINVQDQYSQQDHIIENNLISEQSELVKKVIGFTDTNKKSGQIIKSIATNVPFPAFPYLNGAVKLFTHNYHGHTSYLNGNYAEFGFWNYFLFAFLLKTPISTIILLFIMIFFGMFVLIKNLKTISYEKKSSSKIFEKIPTFFLCLIIPPLIYLIFSLGSHLNLGLRHILPIYPFIFVLLGYLITIKLKKNQIIYYLLLIGLLIFYITSSLLIYPHYLAYFNEIAGGPDNGPKYLTDSNIDWGQDVKKLKKYIDENNIEYICLSYFGQAKLEYYGIDYRYLPDNQNFQGIDQLNCVVAISVTSLLSKEREYDWLLQYEPDEKIGYSIYVYDFRNKH